MKQSKVKKCLSERFGEPFKGRKGKNHLIKILTADPRKT